MLAMRYDPIKRRMQANGANNICKHIICRINSLSSDSFLNMFSDFDLWLNLWLGFYFLFFLGRLGHARFWRHVGVITHVALGADPND